METVGTKTILDENKLSSPRRSKISWAAVFAGTLAALAIIFLLNLLGIGIGLSTVDVLADAHPLKGLGTGTLIWWGIANLIALFVGGMVAAHLSGLWQRIDGALHGFLAWALYTLISLYIMTSALGGVIGGVTGAISGIFGGGKSKEVTVKVENNTNQGQDQSESSYNSAKSKLMKLINTGEKYNVLPDDASEQTMDFLKDSKRDFKRLDLKDNLDNFVNDVSVKLDDNGNLHINVEGGKDFLDKAALKDYLVKNTKLTDQQIDGLINKWEGNIKAGVDKAQKIYAEAKQKAKKYADETADAISTICIIAFFVFLLSAAAAIFGGGLGSEEYRNRKLVGAYHPTKVNK